MKKQTNKPTIETLINTAAIALMVFGTTQIIEQNYFGFVVFLFAMVLEYFKYYGRQKDLW